MSVQVPKLENEARASLRSEAFTVIAWVTRAGEKLHASALELPDAIANVMPSLIAARTALSIAVLTPPPRLMLLTAGVPAAWSEAARLIPLTTLWVEPEP